MPINYWIISRLTGIKLGVVGPHPSKGKFDSACFSIIAETGAFIYARGKVTPEPLFHEGKGNR